MVRRLLRRRCWMDAASSPNRSRGARTQSPRRVGGRRGARRELRVVRSGRGRRAGGSSRSSRAAAPGGGRARARPDDRVELAGQEVGQVERPELLLLEGFVGCRAGIELVAVGALDPLDALALEDTRRARRRPAVGVGRRRCGRRDRRAARTFSTLAATASAICCGRMWSCASTPSTRTPGMPAGQRERARGRARRSRR